MRLSGWVSNINREFRASLTSLMLRFCTLLRIPMVRINMVKKMSSGIQDEVVIDVDVPQIRLDQLDVSLVEVTHSAGMVQPGG